MTTRVLDDDKGLIDRAGWRRPGGDAAVDAASLTPGGHSSMFLGSVPELSCGPTFRYKLAVNRRFEITDDEWGRLAPLLPSSRSKRGGRWRDHRQVLNGIVFRVRTGIPWRDLPEQYGPWPTVYKRFVRWQTDGIWTRIEATLSTQADAAGELNWDAQIDSTVVRAHQHAAGARKRGTRRSRQDVSKRWGGHGVG